MTILTILPMFFPTVHGFTTQQFSQAPVQFFELPRRKLFDRMPLELARSGAKAEVPRPSASPIESTWLSNKHCDLI